MLLTPRAESHSPHPQLCHLSIPFPVPSNDPLQNTFFILSYIYFPYLKGSLIMFLVIKLLNIFFVLFFFQTLF